VEDCGIVLGQALKEALGDKAGLGRYGHMLLPMDEALAQVALDLSGRSFLAFRAEFAGSVLGGSFDTGLTKEFFRALTSAAGLTLHLRATGENTHHMTEALFKAAGRAFRMAGRVTGEGIPSTKGAL
jgi:imidazoleglycerol-phosphate dehydratase